MANGHSSFKKWLQATESSPELDSWGPIGVTPLTHGLLDYKQHDWWDDHPNNRKSVGMPRDQCFLWRCKAVNNQAVIP